MSNDNNPPVVKNYKQYLGDGVYADFDGYQIVLTTDNGFGANNTIYLDPSVFTTLVNYKTQLSLDRN